MKFTHLFFDMDGTLIDSKPGIFNSVYYTLKKLQIPESEWPADLNPFIGPPLRESFKSLFGFSSEMAEHATITYREYYSAKGMHEYNVYPGIPEVLRKLTEAGFRLSLVTSKAEVFAKEIIKNTTFATLFQTVSGCEISGERSGKHELISYTLNKLGLQPSKQIMMIGDRFHDIKGARHAGISSAAVLYGYGSYEELTNEKPTLLINRPEELLTSLL